eukprot:symbB.v1.2.025682.t1/scaffold2496.1/size77716/8
MVRHWQVSLLLLQLLQLERKYQDRKKPMRMQTTMKPLIEKLLQKVEEKGATTVMSPTHTSFGGKFGPKTMDDLKNH